MWGPNPPLLREELELGAPSCLYGAVLGAGLWWDQSQPFLPISDVGIFSLTRCVGVTQLVSGFLLKVVALCVAVYSVHLCEEGSGAFCVTIWVNLQHFLFLIVSIFGWPLQRHLTGPKFYSRWRTVTILSWRVCPFLLLSLYSPFAT